jgi:hypothetical protein
MVRRVGELTQRLSAERNLDMYKLSKERHAESTPWKTFPEIET